MRSEKVTKEWLLTNGGMAIEKKCEVCGETYYDGLGYHPGHRLRGYEMGYCEICYDGNWDGWNPRHEPVLLARLKELGVEPPPRNEDGLLPREF